MIGFLDRIEAMIASIRAEFSPDPRLAIFEVVVRTEGDRVELVGAISEPAAAEALHRRVATLDCGVPIVDGVLRLPVADGAASPHALVRTAIAPLLAAPLISSAQVTQAVLGERLLVLREHGRWLQCRAADSYLGWLHRGYVTRLEERDARAWEMSADGEICISLGAELLTADGETFLRLPWGARVVRESPDYFRLPDGRTGWGRGEFVSAAERPLLFPAEGEAMVRTALRWLGAPYLWGGVTPAGVDCSGLAQAVLRLHGIELPRDSDLQARIGEVVEPGIDFGNLRAGDLLFFAEEADRVSHVVLSAGGSRIVHSSLGNGGVARNDLLGEHPYERELRRLFVCARRPISVEAEPPARAAAAAG